MASLAQQRYEDDRLAQVAIKAGFLAAVEPTWDLLDYDNIDETFAPWAQATMGVIRPWRQASADQSVASYSSDRRLYVPPRLADTSTPRVEFVNSRDSATEPTGRAFKVTNNRRLKDADIVKVDWANRDRAAERSLLVTGPGELKKQVKAGVPQRRAMQKAKAKVLGAASRQVLNGGRDVTQDLVEADDAAVGWIRVTDGDPCAFCALMASRGPVYKSDAADSGGFEAHDNCACIAKPVFSRKAPWPGRAREFRALYDDLVYKKYSGKAALHAFEHFYRAERRQKALVKAAAA